MKSAKVEFLNHEYEMADQVVAVTDIIKASEGMIRSCLVFTEGLQNEWEVGISKSYPDNKFHSIFLYPVNIFKTADEMDSECEGWFGELREIYTIKLGIFDLVGLGEYELMRKLQKMDKVYSNSIFATYDKDLCRKLKWDDETDTYSMMIEDILCKYDSHGQLITSWVCDNKGMPLASTREDFEPYERKVTDRKRCKCQWEVDRCLV